MISAAEGAPTAGSWPFTSDPASRGGRSWLALRLGIVSTVGGVLCGWTLPLAVLAIVLGVVAAVRGQGHTGNAIGGVVFGAIGLLLSVGWMVHSLVVLTLTAG
ncbi:hypothetical protein [Mycetocola reblochoni]|uniref:DUF4190 domain-containing protein n=2 Tax=Mycetocola reblochoni TaxID=331618 RepID=A0A1R4I9I2_9MICO|nr:hypothetical protein [Mycetocola reblochoni]RLP69193.1 hypothetical protein D9V30_07715 [Mycetocola reblochoni]SJN16541.1 hypothetical protein FM119_00570 [Mycetocola reblochoni REB411]